jgi:protein gp37
VFFDERIGRQVQRWKRPRFVFVCSMTDLFGAFVPEDVVDRVYAAMALAPWHTFLVLTKRPERMRDYVRGPHAPGRVWAHVVRAGGNPNLPWPLPNAYAGTSVENAATAATRLPELVATPAPLHFVSAEPLLGEVSLSHWLEVPRLGWVIAGGESGRGARPMHPDWARLLRDQCDAAGVPFLFKQWGEWAPAGPAPITGARGMARVGKKDAGRELDGRTWDGMPPAAGVSP